MKKYLIKTECIKDGRLVLRWLKESHFDKTWFCIGRQMFGRGIDFVPMFIEVVDTRRVFDEWFSLKLEQPNNLKCGIEVFMKG